MAKRAQCPRRMTGDELLAVWKAVDVSRAERIQLNGAGILLLQFELSMLYDSVSGLNHCDCI